MIYNFNFNKIYHREKFNAQYITYQIDLRAVKRVSLWRSAGLQALLGCGICAVALYFGIVDTSKFSQLRNSEDMNMILEVYEFATGILFFVMIGLFLKALEVSKIWREVWVECKDKKALVSREDVYKLYNDIKMISESRRNDFLFDKELWFASTSDYSEGALAFAAKKSIRCFRMVDNLLVEME